jgi:hypothetical protein
MECISTILGWNTKNDKSPLPGASNVEVVYDTSTSTAMIAVRCSSFIGEGLRLSDVSYGGTRWRQKIYVVRATGE